MVIFRLTYCLFAKSFKAHDSDFNLAFMVRTVGETTKIIKICLCYLQYTTKINKSLLLQLLRIIQFHRQWDSINLTIHHKNLNDIKNLIETLQLIFSNHYVFNSYEE